MLPSSMIPLFKVFMPKSVTRPLLKTLFSGYIGQGPRVAEFEKALTKYLGNPYVLTLNSGTSALSLSWHLIGLRPGDEVITSALTCVATNWSILACGASLVWADIDPDTGNLSPETIAPKITSKTKAIVIVDWGGSPCDIASIRKVSFKTVKGKRYAIPLVEDAAHAFGAEYYGKKVGNFADFTCFSFQAVKHFTAGGGGLLTLLNASFYKLAKLKRWFGIDREIVDRELAVEKNINQWGYNFTMSDINAAIGLEQLKYVDGILRKQQDNASYYYKELKSVSDIKILYPPLHTNPSCWLFTIRVKRRDKFQKHLLKHGIMTSQVHRRNDTHPVTRAFKKQLPNLDLFTQEMVCIPVGWWLTKTQLKHIVSVIKYGW